MSAEELKDAGNTAYQAGKFDEAISNWSIAISLADGNKEILKTLYSNRSAAYLKVQNNSAALIDAEKCVELDCNWVKGLTRKGDALYAVGKFIEAHNAYNSGLRLSPGDKALTGKCEQAQRAIRNAADASSSSSSSSVKPSSLLSRIQLASRFAIVSTVLFYILPLGATITLLSYRLFVFSSIVTFAIALYQSHGFPQFSMAYVQRIMPDISTMYLFMSFLLLAMRPYLMAVAPIVLTQGAILARYIVEETKSMTPLLSRITPVLDQSMPALLSRPDWPTLSLQARWNLINLKAVQAAAAAEVYQGVFFIIELILPSRSLLGTLLWWQYLQMRYMLDVNGSAHIKSAFYDLDAQITALVTHRYCPALVARGYNIVKEQLKKRAQPPSASGASGSPGLGSLSSMMSKCTVM